MKKIKIARIVTIPFTLISLRGLFQEMIKQGNFELHIICGNDQYLDVLKKEFPEIIFHEVYIPRNVAVVADLKALFKLIKIFWHEDFSIVHSHTPKAGILTSLAGFISLRKIRIHTFTGQVWANYKGLKKKFFILLDKIIVNLNTVNYVDSNGQREFLIENGVGTREKLKVLNKGSIAGIDVKKFSIDNVHTHSQELRENFFPHYTGKVLLYLGRVNNDKGLKELAEAFLELTGKFNFKLMIVGPREKLNQDLENLLNILEGHKDVHFHEFVKNPEFFLAMCDIYCLPSYREGCPTTVLEASALEKAVLASNIYGIRDIVEVGKTALLFEAGNTKDLVNKLKIMLNDEINLLEMGALGRQFVCENFSQEILTQEMIKDYKLYSGR